MKTLKLLVLAGVLFLGTLATASTVKIDDPITTTVEDSGFCAGWEDGFKSGYCYGRGYGCLEPLAPLCPLPRLGEGGYQAGYNRGFIAGRNRR